VAAGSALEELVREERSRLVAALMSIVGDLDLAEDLVQDAVLAALERWPADGVPARPAAWLMTTARNKGIDRFRRNATYREKLTLLTLPDESPSDERLKLIFTCCHPAIARDAQVALTLRTVCGLTSAEIARAFLTTEQTVAQRLVRAKRKIREARIPYRVPPAEHLNERLGEVLAVVYLMFNEGYLTTSGDSAYRADLVYEAEWLASVLERLMPIEPEVIGLHALIRLHRARIRARFEEDGRIVLLRDQDRELWDWVAIRSAADDVVRASRMRKPGPFQIQAAIVACHAEAPTWEDTDWRQILLLYDALCRLEQSPVFRLNRAIARRFVEGPEAALADLEALAAQLEQYHLFHATRAQLLRDLGRPSEARLCDARALMLTQNPAERLLLEQRLA
jgi:RNA polymerase sigma factor (sigma-70 family)